jgi:Fe-S-cluster containining protein
VTVPAAFIRLEDVTPAGSFSAWLRRARRTLASDSGADVACGECTACCTASYYVYVRADETRALARIPPALFEALPGLPDGVRAIGFDARGHCPLLGESGCTIYEDRPQTCRDFDCRVFPATGIDPLEKPLIAARARRWRFDHPTERDREDHDAVRAAATFLASHAEAFADWRIPTRPNALAVLAIKASGAFAGAPDRAEREPPAVVARAVMAAVRGFEAQSG